MEEIWKDIYYFDTFKNEWVDYRGLYQVSNKGRVKSLNYNRTGQERILKVGSVHDYLQVVLYKNGKMKTFLVHRLVAFVFIENDSQSIKTQVNHIDEDKSNNSVKNLEWCTPKYNVNHGTRNQRTSEAHKGENNYWYGRTGENHPRSRAVVGINIENPTIIIEFPSMRQAVKEGFNQGAIWSCCKGKLKSHKGYYWCYLKDYEKFIVELLESLE